ncbi:MAG: PEP-CTERM sorting domain-containing protein [Akkermansia sp.]|nr:PEP-CTERM sorting domain-containing protein [Akkermansia sp.]
MNKEANAYLPAPEPTTATLSLLALAGLAARRRRK